MKSRLVITNTRAMFSGGYLYVDHSFLNLMANIIKYYISLISLIFINKYNASRDFKNKLFRM